MFVYKKQQVCIINLIKKEVKPHERSPLPIRMLRIVYYPMYYHKLMERMNLLHYGVNKFLKEVVNNAKDCYPLLKTFEYTIDSREDQNYDLSRLESKLSKIMY